MGRILKTELARRIRECKAARREQWPQRNAARLHDSFDKDTRRSWRKAQLETHAWAGRELKELSGRLRRAKATEQSYLGGISDALTFVELEYGTGAYA